MADDWFANRFTGKLTGEDESEAETEKAKPEKKRAPVKKRKAAEELEE